MSVGLFLPLPEGLAKEFPSLGDHDTSPPHVTLMYFGDAPEDVDRFLAVIRSHLRLWPGEITATLRGLRHFDSPHQTVAYNSVRFDADVAGLRSSLISYLSDNGFPSTDMSPVHYHPHVTLAYLPPNSVGVYDGPVPEGSWTFSGVEVWGLGDDPVVIPLGDVSSERVAAKLYHVTGWRDLTTSGPGDSFTLKPGRQNAEGVGVYFSEGSPVKVTTAEGTAQTGAAAVVETEPAGTAGWWRTKPSIARKFNRPITWHTDGKSLSCTVREVSSIAVPGAGNLPLLKSDCSFSPSRVAARYKSKKKVETKDGDEATVYGYGPRQIANRHREKAERVEHLRNHITDLRARVRDDLKSDDPMTRMTALAVALMDHTCERVGNDDSADDGHYVVTGWLKKHVTFGKGKATIKYVGKSGVKHEKTVDHGPTVTALKELCEGRGAEDALFDTDDAKVSADEVNDYLAEFDVTAKDIRGFRANDEMCKALRAERAKGPKDLPRARKEKDEILKAEFKRALETVAEIVGHTESILRSSYLVPGLEDAYTHDGTVLKSLKTGTKSDSQREDEATEKLVKPSPKAKPPRHDLRNERVKAERDPDLDTTDDDLSLNFKKVASPVRVAMAVRVASRYLWAKGANPSEDDAEAEFLKSVKGKLFKTPKSDRKEGVSYSRLKEIDPEMAKAEREKFVPKGGKKDEADEDEADEADKAEAEEKKRKEEAAKPSTPEEITDSVERVGNSEAAKAMSEDDREGLSGLLSSVMEGQSRADNAKLEARITDLNRESVEKLKGGVDRKTVDALRKVPKGLYGKDSSMTTFDSKKSSAAIAKKQKARDKIQKELEEVKRAARDLPAEIKDAEDRINSEEIELKEEKARLSVLSGLKEAPAIRENLLKGTDSESRKRQICDTSDEELKESHEREVAKLKSKVSTRDRAIQKLKSGKDESQKKSDVAKKRLQPLKDVLSKETDELNAMTAYHVSQEHLSSRLTDMPSGNSDPAKRLSDAASHLRSLPTEMADKAIERSKARRDEKKKELDNASEEDREALQKELDLADAELAAGTHDKYLRMSQKEAEKDQKASVIRSLNGQGVGADNEHVQTLLREDATQSEVSKAVYNLADKIPDEDLLEVSDLGSAYDTLKDYPDVMKALRRILVDDLVSDFRKDRAKKTDKGKVSPSKGKATPAKVKGLAEAAMDLPEKDRETVEKVVRETATNLPAADRETVEDIIKLDIPTVGTPPKGEGGESDEKKPRKFKREKSLMERAREFVQNMDIPPAEKSKKLRGLSKMSPADIKAMMSAVMSDEEEVDGGGAKTAALVRRAAMGPLATRIASRFLAYSPRNR